MEVIGWRRELTGPSQVLSPAVAPYGLRPGAPADAAKRSFSEILAEALAAVNRAQHEADARARQLAAGEPVELHDVMMAMEKASLTLEIALAIQRKCVDAYQEISRMQV